MPNVRKKKDIEYGTSKMAQQLKMLAVKPDSSGSKPEAHVIHGGK